MSEKYVKVDDIIEYCTTYSAYLQNKGQGVAQAALRRVKEFAKENATDLQPVKHGHWSEIYHDSENYSATCTNCQEPTVRRVWFRPYDFCPHCGARMDLKDGEKDG